MRAKMFSPRQRQAKSGGMDVATIARVHRSGYSIEGDEYPRVRDRSAVQEEGLDGAYSESLGYGSSRLAFALAAQLTKEIFHAQDHYP
jgi:hypothetical protein